MRSGPDVSASQRQVLVIDDSRPALWLAEGYLSQMGLQTRTASGAEEGLQPARAHSPI
jgi:DNA-binding NtrC family response regulator